MTNTIKTGCLEYPMQNQINAFLEANRQQIINLTSELIKSHNPHNLEDTRPSMKLVQDYLACYQLSFTSLAKQATMPNLVPLLIRPKVGANYFSMDTLTAYLLAIMKLGLPNLLAVPLRTARSLAVDRRI